MNKKLMKTTFACMSTLAIVAGPLYTNTVHATTMASVANTADAVNSSSISSSSVASSSSMTSSVVSSSGVASSSTVSSAQNSSSISKSSSSQGTPKMTATNDGSNLYINLSTGSSSRTIPTSFTSSYDNKKLVFSLSGSTNGAISISLNGSEVGTGQVSSSGTMVKATISLDKAGLKDAAGKTIQINGGDVNASTQIIGDTSSSTSSSSVSTGSSEQKESSESSSKTDESSNPVEQALKGEDDAKKKESLAENNNVNGDFDISIDGDFKDWDDVDKSTMTVNGDNDNLKYAALVADSDNIYFYVMMHPVLSGGYTSFQPSGYDLTVGGKEFWISFNNNQTVNLDVGKSQSVSMNIYSSEANVNLDGQASVSNQSIDQKNGDGSTVKGNGYVIECSIPIKDLKGVSNTSDQTITLKNSNLWDGELTTTGGSTGPVLLASTGIAIAGLSVYKFSRKKRGVGTSK